MEPKDPGDFEEVGDWEKDDNKDNANDSSWG